MSVTCVCILASVVQHTDCISICKTLYCHLVACLLLLYLSTLANKRHGFQERRKFEHKICVLIFSATFVWNISHSEKNWARYYQNCILVFMWCNRHFYRVWMDLELYRRIFDEYTNVKFHENPFSGSWVVPCRQTDRQTHRLTWRSNWSLFVILWMRLKLGMTRVFLLFAIILYALELSACLMKHHGIKTRWREEVQLHPFVCGGVQDTAVLSARKEPGTRDSRIRTREV